MTKHKTQNTKRNGFTLVELMVVVLIISILAALLLPALNRVKEKGYQTYCMGNLHQLGLAMQNYVTDNESKYPWYGPAWTLDRSQYWDNKLAPYVRQSRSVFHCPKVNATDADNWTYLQKGALWTVYPNQSYGLNAYGSLGDFPTSVTSWGLSPTPVVAGSDWSTPPAPGYYITENSLACASQMVAMTDYDPQADDDGDGDLHPDVLWGIALTGRHQGRANVVSCDGHGENGLTIRLRANSFKARWNNDGKAHLEFGPVFAP